MKIKRIINYHLVFIFSLFSFDEFQKIYFNYKGNKVMSYTMVRKTKLVPPTKHYLNIVKQGYKDCKINIKSLKDALMPVEHLQR